MAPTVLLDLPDELVHNIFLHLDASSAANFGQGSKRLYKISDTVSLWRRWCRDGWHYWEEREERPHPEHNLQSATQWKQAYADKITQDKSVLSIFNDLLSTQQNRMARMHDIVENFSYDAKDVLVRQLHAPDDAEDVLARRYWSGVVLGLLHRYKAVQIWDKMQWQDYPPLEDALGAFDLFIQGSSSDFELFVLKRELDDLAHDIEASDSEWRDKDHLAKAVAISRHMREHNLLGCSAETFSLMRYRFITHVLTHPDDKSSIPMQSVVIFCCVAQRLGVKAWPCNFPGKIHAVIEPPYGPSIKDTRASYTIPEDVVWMNPFDHDDILSGQAMRDMLHQMPHYSTPESQYSCLTRAYTRALVLRTGVNIITTMQFHRPSPGWETPNIAFCALWSLISMSQSDATKNREYLARHQHWLSQIVNWFEGYVQDGLWLDDALLFEKYILPLLDGVEEKARLAQILQQIRIADSNANPVTPRDERTNLVKYKVGQIFRHVRYGYVGAIIGWDPSCQAGEFWIQSMRVEDLPRGREQSFYHIICEDESLRYVAEENIMVLEEDPSANLLALAGRYFKRWDQENKVFVSNIQDEYPDD
ncbi:YccV-like-domain-containing protein [Aureobasidium subglaciale]|nr:YccV-like-domain-containing protein [Aureobasidium subglaciale]